MSYKQTLIRAMSRSAEDAGLITIAEFARFAGINADVASRKIRKTGIPKFMGKYLVDDVAELLIDGGLGGRK